MIDHSAYKLGRLPAKAGPALMLAPLLTGVMPSIPASADYFGGLAFPMDANDRIGDCGPAAVAHSLQVATARLAGSAIVVPESEVIAFYSAVTGYNPRTGANDTGVVTQDMLKVLAQRGIAGEKPLAYAKIAANDQATLRAAEAIFGPLLYGVTLQIAQQHQGTWDYKPSPTWGGHLVNGGRYGPGRTGVVSWGKTLDMTDAFVAHQLDEVWVVIWRQYLQDQTFLAGVDQVALSYAFQTLTGRPFNPIPPEGVMRQFSHLGNAIGTFTVTAGDSKIAAIPLDGASTIPGISGQTFPVYEHIKLAVPYNSTPNSQEAYTTTLRGQEVALLARNGVFTPAAAPAGHTVQMLVDGKPAGGIVNI